MDKLELFTLRMGRIGVEIELAVNFPWVYLDRINGVEVTDRYFANHGYAIAFLPIKEGDKIQFTNLSKLFKLIRKYTHTYTKKKKSIAQ